MMKVKTEELIADLRERIEQNLKQAETLQQIGLAELNWRPNKNSWSALECIEHLNLYGSFYLKEIENKIDHESSPDKFFKSGILADYFAKSMLPKENIRKIKTFKDKNPLGLRLDKSSIDTFIDQQRAILNFLDKSRRTNLNKIKVPISITKWLKLNLGNTFRVVIYHNQRHLVQAFNILREKAADN